MTVLSDRSIRRHLLSPHSLSITPFKEEQLQAASYDLTLDNIFLLPTLGTVDPFSSESHFNRVTSDDPIMMPTGAFLLASTVEIVSLPADIVARVEGKSSLGRLGLIIHQTAGFIDPGFRGQITLEISNSFPGDFLLYPGMLIAQIAFEHLDSPALCPYGSSAHNSKYQNDRGPQGSRYYLNQKPTLIPATKES